MSSIDALYSAAYDPNSPIGQMYATSPAPQISPWAYTAGRPAPNLGYVAGQGGAMTAQGAVGNLATNVLGGQARELHPDFFEKAIPLIIAAEAAAMTGGAAGAAMGGGLAGGAVGGAVGGATSSVVGSSMAGTPITLGSVGKSAGIGALGGALGSQLSGVTKALTNAGVPAPVASALVKAGAGAVTGAVGGAVSGKGAGAGAAQGAISGGASALQNALFQGLGSLFSGGTTAPPADAPLGNSGPPTADEIANLTSGATTGDNSLASLSAGNLNSMPMPDPLTYAPGVDPITSDNGGFIAPPSGISNAPMADDTLDLNNIFDNSDTSNDTSGGASGNGNSVEIPGSGMPTAGDIAALTGGATTGDNSLTNLAAGDLNSGSNPGYDPLYTNIGGQSVGITPNVNLGSLLGKLLGGSGSASGGNGTATTGANGTSGSLLGQLAKFLGGSNGSSTGLLSQLLGLGANAGSNILNSDAAKAAAGNFAGQTKFAPYGVSTNNGSTSFNGTNATSALSPGAQAVSNGITGMNTSALANLAAGPGAAQTANFNALTSSQFDAQKRLLGNTQDNEFANGILGSTAGGYQTQGAMNAIGSQISGDQVTAANMANTQQQQQLAQLTAGLNGSNTLNSSQLQQILAGAGIGGTASGANSVAYRPQLSTNANSNIGNILGSLANTQGPF